MNETNNYTADAISDAKDTCLKFLDEIMEYIKNREEVSPDLLNDYPYGDSWHHEQHVDREYDLLEAAQILDQLHKHEETDYGLWSGMGPRQAISAQAAYTYGNAVMYYWSEIIEAINNDVSYGILKDMTGEDDPASDEIVRERVREIIQEF